MVAFALGHPGCGPVHIASGLQREKWRVLRFSANGVWRVLRRHGIGTRALRLGLPASYAARSQPVRESLRRAQVQVHFPVVTTHALTEEQPAPALEPDEGPADEGPAKMPRTSAAKLADLIEAGLFAAASGT